MLTTLSERRVLQHPLYHVVSGGPKIPWTPADITTALWLDASDIDTITKDGSDLVSEFRDKSGNNNHLTSTGSKQPIYSASSLNSKPGITFDGADDWLNKTASTIDVTGIHFIAVYKPNSNLLSNADGNAIFTLSSNIDGSNGYVQWIGRNDIPSKIRILVTSDANAGNSTVRYYTNNQTTDSAITFFGQHPPILKLNGTLQSNGGDSGNTNNAVLTDIHQVTLGSYYLIGGGYYGDFTFGELILLPSAPDTDTIQKLEGYLAHKWGLTANLPIDHSYKNTAPTI